MGRVKVKMRSYSLRLDGEQYELLMDNMREYGDPDLTISFLIRRFIRDLNLSFECIKSSKLDMLHAISYWSVHLRHELSPEMLENEIKREIRENYEQLEQKDFVSESSS